KEGWNSVKENHGFSLKAGAEMVGTVFGPSITTDTLVNNNFGVVASQNVTQNDWVSFNAGVEVGAQNYTHNGYYVVNTGVKAGSHLVMNGEYLKNNGVIMNEEQAYIDFNNIDLSESDYVRLKNGIIKTNDSLKLGNDIDLENMNVMANGKIQFAETTNLTTKNVTITAKELYLQGKITYTEYLGLISKTETDIQHCQIKVSDNVGTEKPVLATSKDKQADATNTTPTAEQKTESEEKSLEET
ncbi:MAG: hypothetical protein ACK4PR_13415, partial [Gammaproteobacteria bacterium]